MGQYIITILIALMVSQAELDKFPVGGPGPRRAGGALWGRRGPAAARAAAAARVHQRPPATAREHRHPWASPQDETSPAMPKLIKAILVIYPFVTMLLLLLASFEM